MLDYQGSEIYKINFKNETECEHFQEMLKINLLTRKRVRKLYRSTVITIMNVFFDKKNEALIFDILKYKNSIPLLKFKITKKEYIQFNEMKKAYIDLARRYE